MNANQDSRARPVLLAALSGLASVSVLAGALFVPLVTASGASPTTPSAIPASNSSGCLVAKPAKPGDSIQYMNAGGDAGAYIQELPPAYAGRNPLPVVVDLHGYDVTAADQVEATGFGYYGNLDGFITITPQVARHLPYWTTGFKSKDVAFLRGVISRVESTLCVDQNRVFVSGYSNGAVMASVLACVDAAQVAAIAPVAGLANPAGCKPSRPVPVVAFHGTSDPLLPYSGGLSAEAYKLPLPPGTKGTISQLLGSNVPQSTKGPSIPKTTAAWARREGCGLQPSTRSVAKNVSLISYSCPNGNAVELYRIKGGGHTWPGSVLDSESRTLGATTMAISADKIIWSFFASHART